jgi:hydroxyacylglutathione hydrolase
MIYLRNKISIVIVQDMHIKTIAVPAFKDNYVWLVINRENKFSIVIDPGDAAPVLHALKEDQARLAAILITHHHKDHSGGIQGILQHHIVPVFGPANEEVNGVTHLVQDQQAIAIEAATLNFQVLSIPGHTRGHIAYYGHDMLFCGDTLFTGGCGRLFEGTAEQMYASLMKLAALPDTTKVYCGHEYTEANLRFAQAVEPNNKFLLERIERVKILRAQNLPTVPSTILEEKQTNPFLRCEVVEVITAAEQHIGAKLNMHIEVFACLRKWKDEQQFPLFAKSLINKGL